MDSAKHFLQQVAELQPISPEPDIPYVGYVDDYREDEIELNDTVAPENGIVEEEEKSFYVIKK